MQILLDTETGYMLRLRYFMLCLLMGALHCYGAVGDSTNTLFVPKSPEDRLTNVDLLERLSWEVTAVTKDGKRLGFHTSKPDSVLHLQPFDTAFLNSWFEVDTSLRGKAYSLVWEVLGSARVLLNKDTIIQTGVFNPDPAADQARAAWADLTAFNFSATRVQQISVTYVPIYQSENLLLDMSVMDQKHAQAREKERIAHKKAKGSKGFYYLAFGIVFLIMFLFYREKRENLHFALFCLLAAANFLWEDLHLPHLSDIKPLLIVLSFEFLAIFFCRILRERQRSRKPLTIIGVVAGIALVSDVLGRAGSNTFAVLRVGVAVSTVVLSLYTVGSAIYFLIKGVGQKRWEARVIILFCLVPLVLFAIFFFVSVAVLTTSGNSNGRTISTGELYGQLQDVIVYIYPLAAVLILGRRNGLNQQQLVAQVASIKQLSEENLVKEQENKQILERQKEVLEREVAERTVEVVAQKEEIERQNRDLTIEKEKADELLRNILPEEVAEELKEKGHSEARLFDNVTVLFADFVDFTKAGEKLSPGELVEELHICFKAFDEIMSRHGIEKIKTIGDAYLAVCGLPAADKLHATKMTLAAMDMVAFMKRHRAEAAERAFTVRVGQHSGSVVAGIVGVKKFAYDIWGDTVNTAARMEQNSEADKINISQTTFDLIKEEFDCAYRGEIEAKNKGMMKMYFVNGRKTT